MLNGIAGLYPRCKPTIVDIKQYPNDWYKFHRRVRCVVMPLQHFITKDNSVYDVVMMLNSYRNWGGSDIEYRKSVKKAFLDWLATHAKYFITSGAKLKYEQGEIDGYDYKEMLQLYKLPLSVKK